MNKFTCPACALVAACLYAVSAFASEAPTTACEEGFDDVAALVARGWTIRNNSAPRTHDGWGQGDSAVFAAFAGPPESYASVGADSAYGSYPIVSTWLITPGILFGPNEYSARNFSFHTRGVPGSANRLVVRLCMDDGFGDCSVPTNAPGDLGDFQSALLDINPDLDPAGYPTEWTLYSLAPADGLPVFGRGRIAFHYYVFAQGAGSYGTTIGIDSASMTGASACPFTDVVLAADFD